MVWPTDSRPVCMPESPLATQDTEKRVRICRSPVRSPSLLAIWMRRWLSAYLTVTWVMAPSRDRAASSALSRRATFRAFGTSEGRISTRADAGPLMASSATTLTPDPPLRAAAEAAVAAARRPAGERSAVWAKPVVSPTTTRMPAPRSRPLVSSSILESSSSAEVDLRSSTNTSANSPPVAIATPSVSRRTCGSSIAPSPPVMSVTCTIIVSSTA